MMTQTSLLDHEAQVCLLHMHEKLLLSAPAQKIILLLMTTTEFLAHDAVQRFRCRTQTQQLFMVRACILIALATLFRASALRVAPIIQVLCDALRT